MADCTRCKSTTCRTRAAGVDLVSVPDCDSFVGGAVDLLEAATDRAARAYTEYRMSVLEGARREAAALDIVLMELGNLMEAARDAVTEARHG